MTAGLGNHSLVVSAGHPSGAFTATGTSNFTVATAQNVTNTHDGGGFVTQRSWSSGPTDNLTWDAAGRLLQVSRRDVDNDGFNEQSIYDPLGRRVRTVYTPYNNSTAATTYSNTSWDTPAAPGQSETTDSWYDPNVEFLEIATVQTSGNVSSGVQWKVYGPDESGAYGGVQGVGGIEAVIDTGAHKISAVWSDMLGHVEAYSIPATITGGSATPGLVTPQSRSSGYGILPGEAAVSRWSQTSATGTTSTLAASLAWQGRRMDASGYYSIGAREYNPTAGRFLSPDPLGQSASWDLYSYAGGDPINRIDCTGRCTAAQDASNLQNQTSLLNGSPNAIDPAIVQWGASLTDADRQNIDQAYNQELQQEVTDKELTQIAFLPVEVATQVATAPFIAINQNANASGDDWNTAETDFANGHIGTAIAGAALSFAESTESITGALSILGGPGMGAPDEVSSGGTSMLENYLNGSGGRWGSSSTRALNDAAATSLEQDGFTITGGAGRASEEYIPGAGPGTTGGTFVDVTATNGATTVRVQTVSTLADGVTPTASEAAAAARIQAAFPNDTLTLIPK